MLRKLEKLVLGGRGEFGGNKIKDGETVDYGNQPVTVHPRTSEPNQAWEEIQIKQYYKRLQPLPLDTPVYPDRVRFLCVSDTHNTIQHMKYPLTSIPADVLIHAGDITNVGKPDKILQFNEFLGKVPIRHKIVIAGNHDLSFDEDLMVDESRKEDLTCYFRLDPDKVKQFLEARNVHHMKDLLTNCTYLQDEETTIYGLKIYGSPWQPEFGDWGFNLPRGQPCLDKWNKIPAGIDVLVTHGPPIGHGDLCRFNNRAGCVELLSTIQRRVKPKYHIFGHIHEDAGITTDGVTTYINATTCNLFYRPHNPPIIFDLPLPAGITKEYCSPPLDGAAVS